MAGLFDNLSAKLSHDEPAGITALDITDLPPDQKQIMLLLLRDSSGTRVGVTREWLHNRLQDRLNALDELTADLVSRGWIIEMGEAPNQRYRINLRAKRGSGGLGLWSIIAERLAQDTSGSGQ